MQRCLMASGNLNAAELQHYAGDSLEQICLFLFLADGLENVCVLRANAKATVTANRRAGPDVAALK